MKRLTRSEPLLRQIEQANPTKILIDARAYYGKATSNPYLVRWYGGDAYKRQCREPVFQITEVDPVTLELRQELSENCTDIFAVKRWLRSH